MTDTAPPPPTDPTFGQQLSQLLLDYGGAITTYKVAQLNAKTKLELAKAGGQSSLTSMSTSQVGSSTFAQYAPWVAGGLLVIALVAALRR